MNTIKHFFKSFLGIALFFVIMFIAAGKIDYPEGWIFFGISVFGLVINVVMARNSDELLSERSKPGADAQPWDKKILGFLAILTMIAYVIGGLDSGRFDWSVPFDLRITMLGILFVLAGQMIFAVAKYQNNFFSSVARIQTDRNHEVCDRGLYKVIRHPGYLGMILSWIGFPLVLNSVYSVVPVVMAIMLLLIRTSLEDRFLANGLAGYKGYLQRTKYRILPYVW